MGVSLDDVNQTLDIFMGSSYVNSFNDFGRHWQVTVQADGDYRNRTEDLNLFQVRNKFGRMVPLGTLIHPREIAGPIAVPRYNLYAAASVSGNIETGTSTGEAIQTIDGIASESLPLSMSADWTELMFLQKRVGDTSLYVFFLAIVSVFLALSALYESWSLPLAVILVVPLCLLCSVTGVLYGAGRQHLRADRPGGAGRAGVQECDPRRRVCQAVARGGPLGLRGHAGGLAAAAAADPHDVAGVHLRSHSLDDRGRGRGGDAPLAGGRRLQRHVRRDLVRHLPHAGVLLRHYRAGRVRLFASAASRWIGSCFLGGGVGLAVGFLLGKLGVVLLPWSAIVGAAAGVLVLAVLEIQRRIKENCHG